MVSSFRFSLFSLFSLLFRFEECHNIQPCEETSMPLTEPDLWISHIRLFSKTHETDHNGRFNIRALSALGSPYLRTANTSSSLCVLLLTPSSVPFGTRRALPRLRLYYELVRLPYRHTSALPLQLVGSFLSERYGSPKFRCEQLDYLPRT